uniref:Uncharacterized protein n=1 Tax=Anguilla anguilla TaxID=7936 RepID=A0A0E9Q1Z3_ANGAN
MNIWLMCNDQLMFISTIFSHFTITLT